MPGLDEDAFPKVVDIVADVAEMASMCHNSIYEILNYHTMKEKERKPSFVIKYLIQKETIGCIRFL